MSRAATRFGGATASRVALILALAGLPSCGGRESTPPVPSSDPPLETVEVGDALDAELDTSTDTVAARRVREETGGVLPGGFPGDLPLPTSTTLVDFEEGSDEGDEKGASYVLLASPRSAAIVSSQLARDLPAAGWRLTGSAPRWSAAKGGRSVRIAVTERGSGCELRIEY